MFILRIIEETRENENAPFEQVVENFEIGKSYSVLTNGITKEFDRYAESYDEVNKDEIAAILCVNKKYDDMRNVFFIMKPTSLKHFSYFIMTESGKTFERL